MPASLIDFNTFVFADGNAGHVIDLGSALAANEEDVLCVNSNTVVSTPAGFTAGPTAVDGQGAYIFRRKDSGAQLVTITTAGNHNTSVIWSRWGNINAADNAKATIATGAGSSSPAHSTDALAETNELSIAFAALHSLGAPLPTAPVWSAGYTPLAETLQGSGSAGVIGYVAYRLDAGTAPESPSVTWTNASASDRYMLTLTFTTLSGGLTIPLATVTETDAAGILTPKKQRLLVTATEVDAAGTITPVRPVVPDLSVVVAPQRAVVISDG